MDQEEQPIDVRIGNILLNYGIPDGLSLILTAGNQERVREIIRQPNFLVDNLNLRFENGDTVYHRLLENETLSEHEIVEIFRIFRERGANSNSRNEEGQTLVHLAITKRMRHVVRFFFLNFNDEEVVGDPILPGSLAHFFVEDEHSKFWRLARGNCDYRPDWSRETVERESASFLRFLISWEFSGREGHGYCYEAIGAALEFNLQHLLLVLLKDSRYAPVVGLTPDSLLKRFFRANRRAHRIGRSERWYSSYSSRHTVRIVGMFIGVGATSPERRWTDVVRAAVEERQDIDIVETLVREHLPNCRVKAAKSALNQLMRYICADTDIERYRQILRKLVDKGANASGDDTCRPVQSAVGAANVHALRWLEDNGVDLAASTSDGRSLLHLLVGAERGNESERQVETLELLLRKGWDVDGQDASGLTPLHLAATNGNAQLAEKLIEHGAKIDCRDNEKRTPLHHTLMGCGTVELLLNSGADVHAEDAEGRTPLWYAASSRPSFRIYWTELLLVWGARIDALDATDDICREVRTLFERHCLALAAAGLAYPHEFLPDALGDELEGYREDCLRDVETMRATDICPGVSLFDFLHMDPDRRVAYAYSLTKLVGSRPLHYQFRIYAVPILAAYRQAVTRRLDGR